MIKDKITAKRYGDAFILFAKEGMPIEKAVEEMQSLKINIVEQNPGFLEVLQSPEITHSEKNAFIDRVLNEDFSKEIKQFLKLLLEKGRIDKFLDIAEYIRITYAHGELEEALLRVSFPLELDLIKKIEVKLEKKLNKKLKFYIELDARILGGVQATVGNIVIDGSLRRRLDELKERLMSVRV